MRILFDQGTPEPLRKPLAAHQVSTAIEMGWSQLSNGELLNTAEAAFDVLVTTDQNIQYQQNLTGRSLAILMLTTTSWPVIRQHLAQVVTAIESLDPGAYCELTFKYNSTRGADHSFANVLNFSSSFADFASPA